MLKKFVTLLVFALLLPALALAETTLPEGYRVEDFGDFTMPLAPNGMLMRYIPEIDDGMVAAVTYLALEAPNFQPILYIWWYPNNMSAYLSRVHPLDYGKELTKTLVANYREDGWAVADQKTIYGMCRQGTFYTLASMRFEEGSPYADEAHDLWVYQRFYGTHDMGTYYFEIYAPTRAHIDAIVKDVEMVEYK